MLLFSITKTLQRIKVIKKCIKCGKKFEVERRIKKDGTQCIDKKEKKYCSYSCSNSHIQTHSQNKLRSEKLKKTLKKSRTYNNSINYNKNKKCLICNKSIINSNKSGYCNVCIKQTDEFKLKISSANKGKTGGLRKGGGKSKHGWYKGYWCDSSWELAFVIYNLEHNIQFKRNTEGFEYEYEGEVHHYYPDFIIKEMYYEIKGYDSKQNKIKHSTFKKPLTVLKKEEMKAYIEYVEFKYGKDFIRLYE